MQEFICPSIDRHDPALSKIQAIRTAYPSPEFIDDSPDTAPSKRIKNLIPTYKKVTDGIVLAERIGIERIMRECPHFRAWIGKIRAIAERQGDSAFRSGLF